ncbi:MAG: permease prefix domain 1-containing protein [Blastocatellia bacterium]
MLNKLRTLLRALLRKSEMEREMDEELRYHIERQTEQNIRLGMNPEEARYAARKAFGGVEQAKERSRDARGVRRLEELWQDLRYGARMLMKNPGFTLVAVITLALGIGANLTIFSFVDAFFLRPIPAREPERLVNVEARRNGRWNGYYAYPHHREFWPRFNFGGMAGGTDTMLIRPTSITAITANRSKLWPRIIPPRR